MYKKKCHVPTIKIVSTTFLRKTRPIQSIDRVIMDSIDGVTYVHTNIVKQIHKRFQGQMKPGYQTSHFKNAKTRKGHTITGT